jgi:exopolysaccharide biosynthesis polyprenyl glycosylphosphotransferase
MAVSPPPITRAAPADFARTEPPAGKFDRRRAPRPISARGLSLGETRFSELVGDLVLVCANAAMVFYLRFFDRGRIGSGVSISHYLAFLTLYAALVCLCCQNQGLYHFWRSTGPLDESFDILKAVVLATLLLTAFIYLSGDKSISRLIIGFAGLLNALTLPAWRFWKREIVTRQVAKGEGGRRALIVGAGEAGQALQRHFEDNKHLGYIVTGFLQSTGGPGVIGDIDDLPRLALAHLADEVFITMPADRDAVAQIVCEARQYHLAVKVVPEMFEGPGWHAPVRYIGNVPVMELLREPISPFGLLIKRAIDCLGAGLGLFMLAPALALLAILIRLDSPGSVLYCSCRLGKKGRKFRCYKLRTMVAGADDLKDELRDRNERDGPCFKIVNDPRVTRVGRWVRKYSLDEFPQLWNVVVGEMSLVGPRPHPLDDHERYQPDYLRRLDVKPGLTGLWQVYARRDPRFETNMALDLEYIENWSLWLDAKILLKTLPAVLGGSGA